MASGPAEHDKYELQEVIGRGAFGLIRKVRRKTDGFILCRKEINYLKMSQKERDQLHAEFSILSTLKNPHIVEYFHREHLKHSQELYLYMEYCGGGDLGTIIKALKKKREYAKEEFVWRILSQLVVALYRCHYGVDPPEPCTDFGRQKDTRATIKGKEGVMILHRDLKPENIFLGEDQSVKLGDFGLSKLMQSHDFASTYVGTPFYMSPEICAAEKYTLFSDVWSVGCIMYELVTHEPPFNANSHLQLIQRIRKGEFKPIPSIYSKDLANVISSCLKVNPQHRPDTASLLSVPYIWLARKQQEMVAVGKTLKTREEQADVKLREAEERLSAMEADQAAMRTVIEDQLRREWEVKARLEIDRQVQAELENLRSKFDKEVEQRVNETLVKYNRASFKETMSNSAPQRREYLITHSSSINTMGEDEFPSTTDLTELSEMSLHSPLESTTTEIRPKKTKTPFARSKTTLDSPADVQMSEPSPISISGLALSPRRNAAAQATANGTTTAAGVKNIFTEAAIKRARWEPTQAYNSDEENVMPEEDSDDDGIPELPSPTRKKTMTSDTDPFKQPMALKSKLGVGLKRQNTTATMQKLMTKPALFPTSNTASAKAEAIKASMAAAAATSSSRPTTIRPPSPGKRISKIPSRNDFSIHECGSANMTAAASVTASAAGCSTSPLRRATTSSKLKSKLTSAKEGAGSLGNAISGRTLVELAQTRAGGRPISTDLYALNVHSGFPSKGRMVDLNRDLPPVPVWDPDMEGDNMPSPFLKRDVRSLPRGIR
ncbi:hypothetical protein DV736_g2329, partial [Chaetothyriales sp. CBS 134916]